MFPFYGDSGAEVVTTEIPSTILTVNHKLKVALLYDADPGAPDGKWSALDEHLKKRGYFLQVIVGSATGQENTYAPRSPVK